jgi:ribosomal protein S6
MPVYRIMAALHPKVKLLQVSATVKKAATNALSNGGSFLDLEDRGLRRAWHPMRGAGQGGPQDQARFINMTCFVKPSTLTDIEETLRKDEIILRVRTTLVAETPYDMIREVEKEKDRARLQMKFNLMDAEEDEEVADAWKKELMEEVGQRKKERFEGHRFTYPEMEQ